MPHPSWGSGFPNCQHNKIKGIVRADGLRLQVRQELITLFSLLVDETERMGYDVRRFNAAGVPVTGVFNCRKIKKTKATPSNHSWGLAIDINSDMNPEGKPMKTDIPVEVRQLWTRFGFRWGGTFKTPDPMHFEYMGAVSDVAADTARAQQELGGVTVVTGGTTDLQEPTDPGVAIMAFQLAGTTAVPGGAADSLGRFPFWGWRTDGSVFAFNGAPGPVPTEDQKKVITAGGPVIGLHPRSDGQAGYYLVAGEPDDSAGFPTFAFP